MRRLSLIILCVIFCSCQGTVQVQEKKYFDLKEFFADEYGRLKRKKTKVDKTVSRNGVFETKKNISPDWESELSLFYESDINKPAWSKSYSVIDTNGIISYTTNDTKLRTRSIQIKKAGSGDIVRITIVNSTKNALYNSSEELLYIPDSLYRIVKKQDVLLLGNNSYEIIGLFN